MTDTYWYYTFRSDYWMQDTNQFGHTSTSHVSGVIATSKPYFPLYEVMSLINEKCIVVGELTLENAIQINQDDYFSFTMR